MFEKLKGKKNQAMLLLIGLSLALPNFVSAADGDFGVAEIITDATTSIMADSKIVIASGLGIGVVFFAARLLWSKFKSMAR